MLELWSDGSYPETVPGKLELERSSCRSPFYSVESCNQKEIANTKLAPLPLISVKVNEWFSTQALVDTGASWSFISLDFWRQLFNNPSVPSGTPECIVLPDNRILNTLGACKLDIEIGNHKEEYLFRIVQGLNRNLILGTDFLANIQGVIDLSMACIIIKNNKGNAVYFEKPLIASPSTVVNAQELHIGDKLSEGQREDLERLIDKYSNVFSDKKGKTNLILHEIRTEGNKVVAQRARRAPPEKEKFIQEEVQRLLKEGAISPSTSPWASPVTVANKKDGSFRLCMDYREINKITVDDPYPMPIIEDILNRLQNPKYLSSLDLNSGFHQLELHPNSKEKTAFVTTRGKYQFNVLPFGLKNSPRSFARLMDEIFRNTEGFHICVYMDDILIASETWEEHLRALEFVLAKLHQHCLTVQKKKCHFGRDQVTALGYLINEQGISVDPDKVRAIQDFPTPKRLKEVQSFLGLAGFHSRFIPHFSSIAKPLHHLKRKGVKFTWGSAQENAFQTLKQAICDAATLATFDSSKVSIISTDASETGLGAVITQEHSGVHRPISYISRLLSPAEQNYNTCEKECLAIFWAIQKFRHYVDGHKFLVKTDHKALQWLYSIKNPHSRLVRWALFLQTFDFQIVYQKGSENLVADALSRAPLPELNIIESVVENFEGVTIADLKESQDTDPECISIRQNLLNLQSRDSKNFEVNANNNLLYRKANKKSPCKIYLPGALRHRVLKLLHDHPAAGHRGQTKTLHHVRNRYYWPTDRTDVQSYVRTCPVCQRYKSRNHNKFGLLQTTEFQTPWAMVGVDIVGPLPRTPRGHKFLLVCVDYCTKFVEIFPLRSSSASNIAKCLIQLISRWGSPKKILSDNGPQFVSKIYKELCKLCRITTSYTSFYHPQTNLTERLNRSVKEIISMYVGNVHKQWDQYLDFTKLAINTSQNETTGFTPFYLNHGREARLPWDPVTDEPMVEDPCTLTFFCQEVDTHLQKAKEIVSQKQCRQAKYYNKNRLPVQFKEGDLVLKTTHVISKAELNFTKKLAPKWEGPYRIHKKLSPLAYQLVNVQTNETAGTWNVCDLKQYQAPSTFETRVQLPQTDPTGSLSKDRFKCSEPSIQPPIPARIEVTDQVQRGKSDEQARPSHSQDGIQIFQTPFNFGFVREVVHRKKKGSNLMDIYYLTPAPECRRLRSMTEVNRFLRNTHYPLNKDDFTFTKKAISRPPFEIVREAGVLSSRTEL